jgi:hypothetical protein
MMKVLFARLIERVLEILRLVKELKRDGQVIVESHGRGARYRYIERSDKLH